MAKITVSQWTDVLVNEHGKIAHHLWIDCGILCSFLRVMPTNGKPPRDYPLGEYPNTTLKRAVDYLESA
jgi:hypothetical protein